MNRKRLKKNIEEKNMNVLSSSRAVVPSGLKRMRSKQCKGRC